MEPLTIHQDSPPTIAGTPAWLPPMHADDVIRVYLHPSAGATLVMANEPSLSKVTRHDIVVAMVLGDEPFELACPERQGRFHAVALKPSTPHALQVPERALLRLNIPLIHPRFAAVRTMLAEPVTALDRSKFAHLHEPMQRAHAGQLDAQQAASLMEAIIDVLVGGTSAPARRRLDPRIVHALWRLGLDIDYPFQQLTRELNLSPSRLSHLFTEELGLSMRGCQAWGRMARAWELVIWQRNLSFTEIAHMMKFSDSSHLARAFKSAYGMPPSGFRDPTRLVVIGKPVEYPRPRSLPPTLRSGPQ